MKTIIAKDAKDLGQQAADEGAEILCQAIETQGYAKLILATGASQFTVLEALLSDPFIPWHRVTLFHLDEYLGLPPSHPASFRKYLWDRFVSQLPVPLAAAHWIDGENNPQKECQRLNQLLTLPLSKGESEGVERERDKKPIDLAFIGIGENGHLAFNDPPADFDTEEPFITVNLDEACRRQQLGEGWFPTLEAVPTQAISMSIKQIMKSRNIICSVPDSRKALAVKNAVQGPITSTVPASILQKHPNCTLYLDPLSAAFL